MVVNRTRAAGSKSKRPKRKKSKTKQQNQIKKWVMTFARSSFGSFFSDPSLSIRSPSNPNPTHTSSQKYIYIYIYISLSLPLFAFHMLDLSMAISGSDPIWVFFFFLNSAFKFSKFRPFSGFLWTYQYNLKWVFLFESYIWFFTLFWVVLGCWDNRWEVQKWTKFQLAQLVL